MTLLPLRPRGSVLVLAPDRDSPGQRDVTGAFRPAAEAMRRELGATVVYVPAPGVDGEGRTVTGAAKQRAFELAARTCLEAIDACPAHLVFCCHGWSSGLQLGFRLSKQRGADAANLEALRRALRAQRGAGTLHSICLFACSSGDEPGSDQGSPGTGDRSLADTIRDGVGVPVLAHWSVGHATRNPDLVLFEASDVPLIGGTVVQRRTPLYRNAVKLLTSRPPSGSKPPQGDVRSAWLSLPLVTSYIELQALLSQRPAI